LLVMFAAKLAGATDGVNLEYRGKCQITVDKKDVPCAPKAFWTPSPSPVASHGYGTPRPVGAVAVRHEVGRRRLLKTRCRE